MRKPENKVLSKQAISEMLDFLVMCPDKDFEKFVEGVRCLRKLSGNLKGL